MRNDTIQRTASDAGTTSSGGSAATSWRRIGTRIGIMRRGSSNKEDKVQAHKHSPPADVEPRERSVFEKDDVQGLSENSHRQLQTLVARVRSAPLGPSPNHVDAAFNQFAKIREQCAGLCQAIVREELRPARTASNATSTLHMNRDLSGSIHFDQRSSFSGLSLAEVMTGGGSRAEGGGGGGGGGHGGDAWLGPIREWKNYLESLAQSFETHLAATYKSYERDATPEMVESLFSSKKFRKEAVHRMRNASVGMIMSADPQFFPRYEIRFRNYERVKQELMDIRKLLQTAESGISPSRLIQEFPVAPRGDVMLEFANLSPDATGGEPALRFRVSSALLAETSPIFARMFDGRPGSRVAEVEDVSSELPPPPSQYFCQDGSEVRLYRMPQLELNKLESLEILLHAAHNHGEELEREISFEQFVAIAECCMRYQCTAPLEAIVEHRWLPQWMHKGADDMPDGLLIISYAFGLRQLFTRTSKAAMLNLVDKRDLLSKPWPQKIRDKVWAVRCAKVDQLYASCSSAIQDYLGQPTRGPSQLPIDENGGLASLNDRARGGPSQPSVSLSSTPRCPKGSHWCDASNLGWMMLFFHEMGLLPHVLQQDKAHAQMPPLSLAQMMDMLHLAPSPPTPVHPGTVCDPAPAFRAAIADVYNSVTGLSLYDISGRSHGWALSKGDMCKPQTLAASGLERMATQDRVHSVVTEFPEGVMLRILHEMKDLRDLHAAARISRAFYRTYKRYELRLMRSILMAGREEVAVPEGKVLKEESDMLIKRGFREDAEVITLGSEETDEEEGEDEDEDEDVLYSDDEGSDGDKSDATIHDVDPPPPFRPKDTDPPPAIGQPSETSEEAPMTDEEARRILWPNEEPPSRGGGYAGVEGLREKFRVGDVALEALEAKTLIDPGGVSKEQLLNS